MHISSLSVSLLVCLCIITTECAENFFSATQLKRTKVYDNKRVHAQSWSQVGDTNGSLTVAYLSSGEDADFKESVALIDAKKEKVLVVAGLFHSLESCSKGYAARNEHLKKWLHSFLGPHVELVTEQQVVEKAQSYLHDQYEQANSIEGEMLATLFDRTSASQPQVRRFIFSNLSDESTPDCYFDYNRTEIGSSQFANYLYSSDKSFGCPHSAWGFDLENRYFSRLYIANNYNKSLFSAITRVGSHHQQAAAINLTGKQVSIYNIDVDSFRSYAIARNESELKRAVIEKQKQKREEVYNLFEATQELIEKQPQQEQRADNTAIVMCIDWGDGKEGSK